MRPGSLLAFALCALGCGRLEFALRGDSSMGLADAALADARADGSAPSVLDTQLGHWPLDDADVDATTVYDRSGRGNHGGFDGDLVSVAGRIGEARELDGIGADIRFDPIAGSDLDLGESDFTLSFWARILDPASTFEMLVSKHTAPGAPVTDGVGFELATSATAVGNLRAYFTSDTGQSNCDGPVGGADPRDGSWHHFAIAVSVLSIATVFVDGRGASCDIAPVGSFRNDVELRLGAGSDGTLRTPVVLDDVRLHPVALSAPQILELMSL
jgi:sialidase-1